MTMRRPRLAALALVAACGAPASADWRATAAGSSPAGWSAPASRSAAAGTPQTTGSQDVFRASTDRVLLSVTVTDARGRLVGSLDRENFLVFEDGRPQDITYFSSEPLPIALSLLLDSSISMQGRMRVAQDAAIGFVRRLREDDVAQVIDFDSNAHVVQTFTRDSKALEAAIRRTEPGGSTSLYQSLYIALSELTRDRARAGDAIRREAIVVLSDGEDTTSLVDYEEVLNLSRRAGVTVYAIGLRAKHAAGAQPFNQAEYVLRTLSRETGGRVFFVNETADLPAVYGQIASELAGQYAIGYRSSNVKRDGAWRRVDVRVARAETATRTRAGYFAPKGRP
jgi:Ca-activated chloride channel family protein